MIILEYSVCVFSFIFKISLYKNAELIIYNSLIRWIYCFVRWLLWRYRDTISLRITYLMKKHLILCKKVRVKILNKCITTLISIVLKKYFINQYTQFMKVIRAVFHLHQNLELMFLSLLNLFKIKVISL